MNEDLIVTLKMDNKQFKEATKDIMGFNQKVNKLSPAFAGWAMSIMFAGMAVQRAFKGIAKSSLTTFQDISHSVEGQVTNLDILAGSWKYLQFTIGEALDPLFAKLAPIVEKIAEWVEKNPKLAAQIISLGFAIGTVAMLAGGLVLAINGISGTIAAIKLATTAFAGLGTVIGLAGTIFRIAFPVFLIMTLVDWIWTLYDGIGGLKEGFKAFGRGVLRVLALVGIGLLNTLLAPINAIIASLNGVINLYNRITKKSIGNIGSISADGLMDKYYDWEVQSFLAPEYGYGTNSKARAEAKNTTNINIGEVNTTQDITSLMNQLKQYNATSVK